MIFNLNSFQIWFKMAVETSLPFCRIAGVRMVKNQAQATDSPNLVIRTATNKAQKRLPRLETMTGSAYTYSLVTTMEFLSVVAAKSISCVCKQKDKGLTAP